MFPMKENILSQKWRLTESKINSYETLDKLNCRKIVRGDLQETVMEDSWSLTAPFRSLGIFLADPARNKCRVYQ